MKSHALHVLSLPRRTSYHSILVPHMLSLISRVLSHTRILSLRSLSFSLRSLMRSSLLYPLAHSSLLVLLITIPTTSYHPPRDVAPKRFTFRPRDVIPPRPLHVRAAWRAACGYPAPKRFGSVGLRRAEFRADRGYVWKQ